MNQPVAPRRFCPICGSPVRPQAKFCSSCGNQFPMQPAIVSQSPPGSGFAENGAASAHIDPFPKKSSQSSGRLLKWAFGGLIILLASCVLSLAIYIFLGDTLTAIFWAQDVGLSLNERRADGEISGSYRYPEVFGDHTVEFSVTKQGLATYRLSGGVGPEELTVRLPAGDQVELSWGGNNLDGVGELSSEERAALEELFNGDMSYALAMVPLDLGCQEGGDIEPQQLAALLVPLQMKYKYLISERAVEANRLVADSVCDYGDQLDDEDSGELASGLLSISSSMPVPVVFGYFPFDEEGAIEQTGMNDNLDQIAALDNCSIVLDFGTHGLTGYQSKKPEPYYIPPIFQDDDLENRDDEYGPCNSKCRGACGVDCTRENCEWSEEWRCEVDEDQNLTGYKFRWDIYSCGVHTGCIDHDTCYDKCNQDYGCGTWGAAFCRHNTTWVITTYQPDTILSCDGIAIKNHSVVTSANWARGKGPYEGQMIFAYQDNVRGRNLDLELCPAVGSLVVSPQELNQGRLHFPYFFKLEAVNLPDTVTTVRFDWDFGDDGSQDYPAEGSQYVDAKDKYAMLEISHKYVVPGDYIMLVQLFDDTYSRNRLMVEFEVPVHINPDKTSVTINPRGVDGIAKEPVSFTAEVNNPGNYRFDWIFGDTKMEDAGPTVSHTFENPGEYSVKVSLHGPEGLIDDDEVWAIIGESQTPTEQPAPEAPSTVLTELIIIPSTPVTDSKTQFIVVGENLPANPSFDWDFGEPFYQSDGHRSFQLWTDTPEAIWDYSEAGTFQITVLVRDKNNYSVILDELIWWISVTGAEEEE